MLPIVDAMAREHVNRFIIVKVDTSKNPDIALFFNIRGGTHFLLQERETHRSDFGRCLEKYLGAEVEEFVKYLSLAMFRLSTAHFFVPRLKLNLLHL